MAKRVPRKQERSQPKAVSTKKVVKVKQSFIEQLRKRRSEFGLTPKQLKYRHNRFVLGMSQVNAAVAAGYGEAYARKRASRIDGRVKVSIVDALDRAGATDRVMAESLFDIAKNATKMQKCTMEVRQSDGEIVIDDESRVEVPDLHLRKDTWIDIARIKKHISSQPLAPSGDDQVNWIIVVKEPAQVLPPPQPAKVIIDAGYKVGTDR